MTVPFDRRFYAWGWLSGLRAGGDSARGAAI